MWPASTSTAMPSGSRHSVTMTLRSEPSGFTESTRLPLASRTNSRPIVARPTVACFDCEDLSCAMFCPFIVNRAASAGFLTSTGESLFCRRRLPRLREVRLSLLEERGQCFLGVRRAQQDGIGLVLDAHRLFHSLAGRPLQEFLGGLQRAH